MKTVGIIAEYNPLHLGHIKQIEYVKNVLKADKIIIIMSGNFTQRGEGAVLNKFTRAKEAVKAGADTVIELPTLFAVSNAEVFAKGAIKILNSLKIVDEICFGVESGSKEDYIATAKALNKESLEYKSALKKYLDKGVSLAKAKFSALKELNVKGVKEELLSSPNNILGLEYTKAILSSRSKIKIEPLIRENIHNDKKLKGKITSALSIRETIKTNKIKKVKNNLPAFVYKDLSCPPKFDDIILTSLATERAENMANILDCTEGLENRIKALLKDNLSIDKLIEKVSTKRYTETRIKRILIANLLKINKNLVFDALSEKLYVKILAINNGDKEFLSLLSKKAKYPLIIRKSDADKLKYTAKECFNIDVLANDLYNIVTKEKSNEHTTLFV